MQDRQKIECLENAGMVLRAVVVLLLFAGPVLWVLLGDMHMVERAAEKIGSMREWLESQLTLRK